MAEDKQAPDVAPQEEGEIPAQVLQRNRIVHCRSNTPCRPMLAALSSPVASQLVATMCTDIHNCKCDVCRNAMESPTFPRSIP